MGIDLIRGGRIPNRGRRATKSSNTYLKTLIKVINVTNSALLLPVKKNRFKVQQNYSQKTQPIKTQSLPHLLVQNHQNPVQGPTFCRPRYWQETRSIRPRKSAQCRHQIFQERRQQERVSQAWQIHFKNCRCCWYRHQWQQTHPTSSRSQSVRLEIHQRRQS